MYEHVHNFYKYFAPPIFTYIFNLYVCFIFLHFYIFFSLFSLPRFPSNKIVYVISKHDVMCIHDAYNLHKYFASPIYAYIFNLYVYFIFLHF